MLRKNQPISRLSKYSALARNVIRRRITRGMTMQSMNDTWLEATITGPRRGTRRPFATRTRKATRRIGVRIILTTQYIM